MPLSSVINNFLVRDGLRKNVPTACPVAEFYDVYNSHVVALGTFQVTFVDPQSCQND